MISPILNKVGATFIPVSNLKKARDWYSIILGLEVREEYLIDHLYIVPMDGTGVVLDSQIYSKENVYRVPAFHFNTNDIKTSYQFMKDQGVELLTEIENGHWFNFKDPDGNVLMICKC
ncbi:VOC family protein [Paenibacillus crassostreae]|uniref:Glyoxalase n=1 Tax=Paenibacillus crassostreae TaxID=1763538 RepID=A0A167FCN8_9BACL|nr:VOC family protein [Paenibacillus crassostreae]AOZ90820.1 glyoxalase [Paenibacillus crassostreae]OAB76415.1 glyoxalase [Paenibacillus crassostreae]